MNKTRMQHGIVADTKTLCRVCMASELEHAANLYDAPPSGLPSWYEMLRAICTPVFANSEPDDVMPEKPTKVCLVCQNAVVAAYNLHQQCIETDRRLGELAGLMWELQGGDEIVEDCGDPGTSSANEVTMSMGVEKKDKNPKQSCTPIQNDEGNSCLECGKTYSSRASLVRHIRDGFCDMTNDPKKRTCEICKKVLKTVQLLKRHREMHAEASSVTTGGERPVDKLNTEKPDLIKVESMVVEMSALEADSSAEVTKETMEMVREEPEVEGVEVKLESEIFVEQNVKCLKCDESFESQNALRKHNKNGNCLQEQDKTSKSFPWIFCQHCGSDFRFKRELRAHTLKGNCLGDEARTCPVCQIVFDTVQAFKKHRQDAHPGPVDCPHCGRKQATFISIRSHLRDGRCENIKNGSAPGIVFRRCKICGESQASVAQLKSHMKAKHLDQIFYCKACLRHFSNQIKFDEHMEKHEKKRVNVCQTCNTSFPTITALRNHKPTHGRVKCTVCDKTFSRSYSLKEHMSIHSGEQPYACDLCQKRFRTAFGKRTHMQTHSDQRPMTSRSGL